ncbi:MULTISPECIES: Trk system potassium transporter TrkA [unclassified Oscillibacter]|uniref:Trk system potassium transporter TrkA n=1 Tax=unclassified Oscillibacter TaxID=2629304 RepID=UPI0025DB57EF|nr:MULTISPECIES: Trk system potassium transporter TrkA [unclassified Oscillibacter]
MKIIIVGAGKVGLALAQSLSREHSVTVIDQNPRLVEHTVNVYDVMGVCGNGASAEVLKEADAGRTELLIATAPSDELNILICLVAKYLGVEYTIARIRHPEYGEQLRYMRSTLGLSMAINPERATAREIARVLRYPNAMKVESFSKGRLELVEYRLDPGSTLNGMRLSSLQKSLKAKVLICAVARNEETIIPSGDFVLQVGDTIYITASAHELEQFFRHLGVFKSKASSVMIVGASKLCYYLGAQLLDMGMTVKIIEQDTERSTHMSELLPRALVITGDGADSELLREEGLGQTDGFVSITGMDEANILMSLSVARQNPNCKVITKINRQPLVDLVAGAGLIGSVVSTGSVTTELILQYVLAMQNASGAQIKTLHRLIGGKVEALEFGIHPDSPLIGVPLRELKLRPGVLLAGIVRQSGKIVIPSGSDTINAGDDVIVVATSTLHDIRDILR